MEHYYDNTRYCTNCGAKIKHDYNYCPHCGCMIKKPHSPLSNHESSVFTLTNIDNQLPKGTRYPESLEKLLTINLSFNTNAEKQLDKIIGEICLELNQLGIINKSIGNKVSINNSISSKEIRLRYRLRELFLLVEICATALSELVNQLKCKNAIDRNAPSEENNIIIPLNCSYSYKYFAKLCLLEEHTVVNQIVSQYGVIQYQIPINPNNEEMILLTCGEHFLKDVYAEPQKGYGKSLIKQDLQYLVPQSRVLRLIKIYKRLKQPQNPSLTCRESDQHFEESVQLFRQWYKDNTRYFYHLYENNGLLAIKWRSEYKLFQFIRFFFIDAVFQYRTEWLGDQSFDVYIPSLNTAIEYQGKQHYDVVEYFGGIEKYHENQMRDWKKRYRSEKHGITLYEWKYTKPVDFTTVREFIQTELGKDFTRQKIVILLKKGIPIKISALLNQLEQHKDLEKTEKNGRQLFYCQYDYDGRLIQKYDTMSDAAIATNTSKTQIANACKGRALSAGGYLWRIVNEGEVIPESIEVEAHTVNTSISVYQCSSEGEILQEFPSITQASAECGIDSRNIRKVLNGKQKTAGGYRRMRVGEKTNLQHIDEDQQQMANSPVGVYQCTIEGEVIREFSSITNASNITGIDKKSIRSVLQGKQKTAGGFRWVKKNS